MAVRDRSGRTVFIGVCLSAVAFLSCWLAASIYLVWLSTIIYVAPSSASSAA